MPKIKIEDCSMQQRKLRVLVPEGQDDRTSTINITMEDVVDKEDPSRSLEPFICVHRGSSTIIVDVDRWPQVKAAIDSIIEEWKSRFGQREPR